MPPMSAAFCWSKLFAFLGVLALLVRDAAAGLASRLARGLALAATAVLCALAKVTSFDGFDMFHDFYLHEDFLWKYYSIFFVQSQ